MTDSVTENVVKVKYEALSRRLHKLEKYNEWLFADEINPQQIKELKQQLKELNEKYPEYLI